MTLTNEARAFATPETTGGPMKFRLFSSAAAVCALLGACAVDVPVDDFAEVDSVSAAICAGGLPDCQAQCQCAFKTEYEARR